MAGAPLAPLALERRLRAGFRLIGPQGLVGIALAGIDMAAWDALAKAAGLPLAQLLGADRRPVPAYHSLGLDGSGAAAREAEESAAAGFRAVKFKVGHPDAADDVAVVRAARRAGGDALGIMVDYNQKLSVPEAIDRARILDGEGLIWIEEPTAADDDAGHARIAAEARTPIQLGENWWGPRDMARSLTTGAADYAMLDAMKIGGVSGWLRAAALAESRGVPVSSHLFPELSAHLLAATPTAHWLEYHDWADPVLQEPLRLEDGVAVPSRAPGTGVAWDEEAVRRFLVD